MAVYGNLPEDRKRGEPRVFPRIPYQFVARGDAIQIVPPPFAVSIFAAIMVRRDGSRCRALINPRRACAAGVTVPSVRLCTNAQQGGQKAIPTDSVPHWLDFKNGVNLLRSKVMA